MTGFNKTIILFSLFTMLSCSMEKVSPIKHEKPVFYENEKFVPQNMSDKFLSENDLNLLKDKIASDSDILNEVIKPLSGYVLDMETLRDPRFTNAGETVRVFNSAILTSYSRESSELESVLVEYSKIILHGCDRFLNNCVNINILRRSNNISEVLKIMAEREKDDYEKFLNFIFIAFDTKTQRYDRELEKLYLENIYKLENMLQAIDDPKIKNEIIKKHSNIIVSVVQNYAGGSYDLSSLVSVFDVWNFENRSLIDGFNKAKIIVLKEILSKNLYEENEMIFWNKDLRLNKSLYKAVKSEQTSPLSIMSRLSDLKINEPVLFNGLELKEFEIDEYFILVDKIFNSQWNLDVGVSLWDASLKDTEKLLKLLKNYVMAELSFMILESNKFFKANFYDKDVFDSENIFWQALESSGQLRARWHALIRKFDLLHELSNSIENELFREKAKNIFKNITHNIKYMVVYPNMMLLSYKLSETDFNKKINTIFGSFVADSKLVFKTFFNGGFEPWFDFGNDSQPLNRYSIIYAFDYALRTDTFNTYGIDAHDFLQKIYDELIKPKKSKFDKIYKDIRTLYENETNFERFINICEKIQKGLPYHNSISLSYLKFSAFLGEWSESNYKEEGDGEDKSKNLYTTANVTNMEWIRTEFYFDIVLLDSMVKIYEHSSNIQRKSLRDPGRIKDLIKEINFSIFSYFKYVLDIHKRFGECETIMFQKELEVQNKIYFEEIKYLKAVFKDMTDFREGKISSPKKYESKYLVGKENAYDYFDYDFFNYNAITIYYRIKEYMERVEPNTDVILPKNIDKDEYFGKYFLKPDIRFVKYVDKYETYEENELEFIKNAFLNLRPRDESLGPGHRTSLLRWLAFKKGHSLWFEKVEFMVSLFKSSFMFDSQSEVSDLIDLMPSQIIEEIKTKITIIDLDREQEDLLSLFGLNNKFELDFFSPFKDLFINYKTKRVLPFFSLPYLLATEDMLGWYYIKPSNVELMQHDSSVKYPTEHSHLNEAERFYNATKDLERLFLKVDKEVITFIDNIFQKVVDWRIHVESSVRSEILKEEYVNKKLPQNQQLGLKLRLTDERVLGPYYDKFKVQSFRAKMKNFHKITGGYFDKEEN